ncbi:MAG: FAD-dependent oxidoreductase [Treponema sp.]|nr:FAD-dependent oxidoreductase [Treponema sp.]
MKFLDNRFLSKIAILSVCLGVILMVVGCGNSGTKNIKWDYQADVVIIGAGGAGLPAGLKALEDGASVLFVETNWDVGGHAAVSEGQLHSGGGTVSQQEWGIDDSADLYYFDHTRGGAPDARYNDRAYARSVANSMAESYDFILKNGVKVLDIEPMVRSYYRDGGTDPDSVGRMTYADSADWVNEYTGTTAAGVAVTRPLEKSLREKGAKFLLNYHMDKIYREDVLSGKVLGVQASYTPHVLPGETTPLTSLMSEGNIESTKQMLNIKANKGVIIATGGSTGNVAFRTMFDARLGPEYDGLGGMPFSDQDASGEIAAMEIGAALASLSSYQMLDGGAQMKAPSRIGCQYGYGRGFMRDSKIWALSRATGIEMDYGSMIIVNMLGARFGNEDDYGGVFPGVAYQEFLNNAASSVFIDPDGDGNAECYGGPIWAIVDDAAAKRNDWVMEQGVLDFDNGYAFKADTLEELAQKVVNKYYEHIKMDPKTLVDTVNRYNNFVAVGKDGDWGKKSLDYPIRTGPFYALWAVSNIHDTLAGLRVDENMQVVDLHGKLIPNLFCAGEASGGMRVHGLGRVITSGYIAGRAAVSVDKDGFATASTSLDKMYAGSETSGMTKTDKAAYYSQRGSTMMTKTHSEKEAELAAIASGKSTAATGSSFTSYANVVAAAASGNMFVGASDKGMGGTIRLQITVENGKITAIKIIKHNETPGIGPEAMEKLTAQALQKQSAELDVVSGATMTSNAFMEALALALKKAAM